MRGWLHPQCDWVLPRSRRAKKARLVMIEITGILWKDEKFLYLLLQRFPLEDFFDRVVRAYEGTQEHKRTGTGPGCGCSRMVRFESGTDLHGLSTGSTRLRHKYLGLAWFECTFVRTALCRSSGDQRMNQPYYIQVWLLYTFHDIM